MPKKKSKGGGQKAYKKRQRKASHAGFHFHNLYDCCQIKWFTRFIMRIEPRYTPTPLLNGSAFHEGKATFYRTGKRDSALRKVESELRSRKSEFENDEEYLTTADRCPILLDAWIEKFGHLDLERFKPIAIEKSLEVTVPGTDYIFTIRPDAIMEDRETGEWVGMETKTSSFSIKTTEMGVYYGDQATAYMWAAGLHYKKPIAYIIPDIAYWNKQATGPHNIKCTRGDLIKRSDRRIRQYVSGLAQQQSEMAQKVEAYRQGYDPYTLWRRNTHYCNAFFKPCEFAEICDNDLTRIKRLPPGYRREKNWIRPKMHDAVEDSAVGIY